MLRRKFLSLSKLSLFERKTIFSRKIISERKNNYCHGFMPGDFQVIWGSMVDENHQSPASTETPEWSIFLSKTSCSKCHQKETNRLMITGLY